LTEFGYEESISPGLAITTVYHVESLKYHYSYNYESVVHTLSKQTTIGQIKVKDNTSKSHKGKINKQPTKGPLYLIFYFT
jgi:hypothetical protein